MEFSDEVIQSLKAALDQTPANLALRRHLAEIMLLHGEASEAIAQFRLALKLAPNDAKLLLGLGEAYFRASKFSAAQVVLEEVLNEPMVQAKAQLLLSRLLLQKKELQAAQQAYQEALKIDPDLKNAELERALFVQIGSELKRREGDADGGSEASDEISAAQMLFSVPENSEDLPMEPSAEEANNAAWRVPLPVSDAQQEALARGFLEPEQPQLTFNDVGGMDSVKEEIELKIIKPIQHPELFQAYGKKIGGGVLMYGPPGCGKTHLARATAGEVNATFISVGINDILDMWLGKSERNLHAVFEQARAARPCVLFFDEVDALGASRTDMRQSAGRQLINQFLLELDGVQNNNEGVLILAATNTPWHLDTAFRRPGRFDRMIFVPPPDLAGRAAVLDIHLASKPVEKIDLQTLAKKSEAFSGADLKAVVETAIEAKLRDALKTGVAQPLRQKDLLKALKQIRPTTQEWFSTARNYALYANQSGFYDDILHYLNLK